MLVDIIAIIVSVTPLFVVPEPLFALLLATVGLKLTWPEDNFDAWHPGTMKVLYRNLTS